MFLFDKTYDIDELCKCNMHMHSVNSLCSKPEMIFEDIVAEAEKAGLSLIAVTDHSDPGSDIDVLANTLDLKARLAKINTPVKVLIGSELSAYGIGKYADDDELNKALDYRSYSHVHYHLHTWTQPEDRTPYGYSRDMLAVLSKLFEDNRADSIAHPFSPCKMKFFNDEEKHATLDCITDDELAFIMQKGEKSGCAWELHRGSVNYYPEFYRRFFHIGKEVGVHFTVGTDAHNLLSIHTDDFAKELHKYFD